MRRVLLVACVLLLARHAAPVAAAARPDETLAISTFRLDLTIESSPASGSRGEDGVDSTVQSAAEKHLASVYALELDSTPTQVLLTVVSDDDDDDYGEGEGEGEGEDGEPSGIVVRQSFVGGVVSLPADGPPLPSRSELDEVTLRAFDIPGYGEYFLKALRDADDPGLDGLLLVVASEVDGGGRQEGGEEGDADADAAPAPVPDPAGTSRGGEDVVVIGGTPVNVWAVAAVAALGAMFLVVVLCTSALYCDWRGRRNRRRRDRKRRAGGRTTTTAAARGGAARSAADAGGGDVEMTSGARAANNKKDLRVVIPSNPSGETEGLYEEASPPSASWGSTPPSSSPPAEGGGGGNGNGNGNGNGRPPERMVVVTTTKRYRTSGGGSRSSWGRKSKSQSPQSQSPPEDDDARRLPPDDADVGDVTDDNIGDVVAASFSISPTDDIVDAYPAVGGGGGGGGGGGEDAYSVGEDTAMMLYPNINRNRASSRDYYGPGEGGYASDDFDGYSIDGMSAIGGDGVYSQFGGSGGGSGGGSAQRPAPGRGGRAAVGGGGGRGGGGDVYYAGEVPRDFDSVWGDDTDDEGSRATTGLASSAVVRDRNGHRADLNNGKFNMLVEQEVEDGESQSGMGSVNSASETSGSMRGEAGAFTLELLGKGVRTTATTTTTGGRRGLHHRTGSTGGSSTASAATPVGLDDDDSILGGMYRDDEEEGSASAAAGGGGRLPNAGIGLGLGMNDDDLSAIVVIDADDSVSNPGVLVGGGGVGREGGDADVVPSCGDIVDSAPSWTAPGYEEEAGVAIPNSSTAPGKVKSIFLDKEKQQELRTNEKFVSSLLNSDESSVGSNRSRGSHRSSKSTGSGSNSGRGVELEGATTKKLSSMDDMTAKSSKDKALGLTNSMDEEVDEDPAAMIDNINSMLSECREILDTENTGLVA
ncbi:hypothetical protein ACHAW5_009294 [Stephanodiscus triporus]|uniref:Cadherin domain-containing protein n=1 Tax=Stephanodiscus triporus TaxID=2934178 RepID=A0ABD3PWG2_9STRA